MQVTNLSDALRNGVDRKVRRADACDLVPGNRRRDGRLRLGANRVRRCDRLVGKHLVEIYEDALAAFFLPPGGGHAIGGATLELSSNGEHSAPHLRKGPATGERDVHVDAPAT